MTTTLPQQRSLNPWLIRLPILLITGTILLLMALLMVVVAFRVSYAERITPGVTVFGVDLGGLTADEAMATLNERFTYDETTVFTFRDGDRSWQLTAAELGLSFDVEATVNEAMRLSSGDNPISGLMGQAQAWFSGEAVAPIIHYDQSMAVAHLTAIAAEINQSTQEAQLTVSDDGLGSVQGRSGRTLDIPATLAQLDAQMLSLTGGGEISLIVQETLPRNSNVQDAISALDAALSGPIQLTATSPDGQPLGPWTISTEQIAALVTLERVEAPDGTITYTPSVDMSGFAATLEQLAPGLRTLPEDGRFNFDETTRQLVVTVPSVPGRELDIDATLRRLEDAVFRTDMRTVPMAFELTLPQYHDGVTAAELGITQLVSESTTHYTGSDANRRHNIAEGASRYDGIIIPPDGEFSFNDFLGDVSLEAGFLEGKVIVGGSTVNGVGGGICQVSTTAFRAALNGGYWISERNTHAYRVGYYELNGAPPGLDAAIWSPERDFKFINDTPHHLLIETTVLPAQDALQFRFYSTDIGRVVEIQAPQIRDEVQAPPVRYVINRDLQPGEIRQIDYAADGMDVTVVRLVTEPNGETRTDRVFTHYLPWQAVYEVAPGDSRANTSGSG